jgi:hypothetical protein
MVGMVGIPQSDIFNLREDRQTCYGMKCGRMDEMDEKSIHI